MKKNIYITVIVGFGIFMLSIGQLISQQPNLPHERVTLVTDRDLYISGETIWFTASCFLENGDGPSPLSQILYVELFNASQKVFVKEKFKLTNGRISAYLIIPEELPTAHYFIRAYTMYLRNFPPESYFTMPVEIINPEVPANYISKEENIEIYVQNGKLVMGLPNKIAFKIPPSEFDNILFATIHSEGKNDTTFTKYYKEEFDNILFQPKDSTNYKLYFIQNNLDSVEYSLPEIDTHGFIVLTTLDEQNMKYSLLGNIQVPLQSDSVKITIRSKEFSILFQQNFNKNKIDFEISRNILSNGINYIELRSENDSLINLTAIYNSPQTTGASPDISTSSFIPRQKVSFIIDSTLFGPKEIEFLQVSVVKKGTVKNKSKYIPEIYRSNPGLLNNINFLYNSSGMLLMHAEQIKKPYDNFIKSYDSDISYVPEIRDVSLSGLARDKYTKRPVARLPVFASVLHNDFQFHHTETDADGRFAIDLPYLKGMYDMFLGTNMDTSAQVELLLNNDFSTEFAELHYCPLILDTSSKQLLEEMYINQQVSNNLNGFPEMQLQSVSKLPQWFGNDLDIIELKDYIALSSIQEVFNEIVPSVRLKENGGKYILQVYDDQSDIYYDEPLVLLDGIPITDINILLQLYPAKIDRIEVLNRTYILGNYTIRGLVSIKTKTDNFGGVQLPDDVVFVNYQTRSARAEFIPLNIETDSTFQRSMPLFKNLLYYNSFYSLSEIPERISFYTSDHLSEYEIIVRGKTIDGGWIVGRNEFRVIDE